MKKTGLFLFMLFLSLSLVACGNSNDKQEEKVKETATPEPEKTEEPTPEPTVEPTETPVEIEEPTEDTTPEPTDNTKEISKKRADKFLTEIKELIEYYKVIDDTVQSVTYEKNELIIAIGLSSPPANFTKADLAQTNASSITDAILDNKEYDDYWDSITFDFGETGSKTFTKEDIVIDGSLRYFEVDFTDFNQ